jgi:hypothetical protein
MPTADSSVTAWRAALGWIDRHAVLVFSVLALVAFVLLLYLGRTGSFFQDEWTFIRIGGLGTVRDWFAPHNEHWSTVPFALYRALLLTVGLGSYLPYLALLLSMHILAAGAIFVLVRRASGSIVALLAAGLFLLLGGAYQNLFWAFQIGFVGSTAAGLWALVALERDRPRWAALLFLIAVASSTMGLPFVVMGGIELILDRRRRRQVGWLVAVAVAFVVWFLLIGREGLASDSTNVGLAKLLGMARFAVLGIADGFGATFGVGRALGATLAIAAVALGVWRLRSRRLQIRAVAAAIGLLALYLLIGFGRAQLGDAQGQRSRYLYEAAAFLLVGLASLVGGAADPLAGHSGRSAGPGANGPSPIRRQVLLEMGPGLLVLVLVGIGFFQNVRQLVPGARFFREASGELRGTFALMERYGPALPYQPPPSMRWSIPSPADLTRTSAIWGSPARDVFVPSVVKQPTALERDRALWRVVGNATLPRTINAPPGAPTADEVASGSARAPATPGRLPTVVASTGATLVSIGDCVVLRPANVATKSGMTTGMTVDLRLIDDTSVAVTTIAGGNGAVSLGREARPDAFDQASTVYPDRSWVAIGVPRLGDGSVFTLRLLLPPTVTAAAVCAN